VSEYQIAFLGLFALAVLLGRPDWRIAAIWLVSFGVCMAHAGDEMALAAISVATAAFFSIVETRRAQVVAGLYATMAFSYVFGVAFAWPESTTYGIVELLGVAALGVIGGVDRGLLRLVRRFRGSRRTVRVGPRRDGVFDSHRALADTEKAAEK